MPSPKDRVRRHIFVRYLCAAIAERFALLVDASTRCLLIAAQVRKEICQHIFKTGVIVGGVSDHVLLTSRSLIRAGLDLCL